ncbi:MAG: aminotransferase class I/II-fold pyridoxal phosphate-dependent enzyme [Alphaproteobacteria bacterium]|nr:aminotransferase class I/II-fold pyridoxal phosphate-dependent enzyme [Alphaproteobacteria bacterium]
MGLFDKHATTIKRLDLLKQSGIDPFAICVDQIRSPTHAMINGRDTVLAGTNNYLGLTFDQACIDAAADAVKTQGTATTGSRIANGTYPGHLELEKEIASFLDRRAAIVFSTGFQANLGILAGLAGPTDLILLDADSHASIYDGCTLSGATLIRFRHNSPADLDKRLERLKGDGTDKLIVVESIYSMLGDQAPLDEFADVKRRHGVNLFVDEAHSLGVFGDHGQGLVAELGIEKDVDFVVGTFSKSLGSVGGFAASDHPQFEILRYTSRPYMYTASSSPANIEAALEALKQIRARPELKTKLWENANALYGRIEQVGLELCAPASPIIAVKMPDEASALFFWNALMEAGVYVNLALPPGTPNGACLLRCSLSAAHSPHDVEQIGDAFAEIAVGLAEFAADPPQHVSQKS